MRCMCRESELNMNTIEWYSLNVKIRWNIAFHKLENQMIQNEVPLLLICLQYRNIISLSRPQTKHSLTHSHQNEINVEFS